MSFTLYGQPGEGGGRLVFGRKPPIPSEWQQFGELDCQISLKFDMQWKEDEELQGLIRKSDIWEGFPAVGYTLVIAEAKVADENQRVDLLYMREDGAILPCELKIGGKAKDAHGQLLRYIADLYYQDLSLRWTRDRHKKFAASIKDAAARGVHETKFENFIKEHAITDKMVRLLPRSGVLMDERFSAQELKTVRYLNGYCGFGIRTIRIRAFVDAQWSLQSKDYKMRIEFVDIQ